MSPPYDDDDDRTDSSQLPEGGESEVPRTGLPELDENETLFRFVFAALDWAIEEVTGTGTLVTFVILEAGQGPKFRRFESERLETGYDEARRAVLVASIEVRRYALGYLGMLTQDGVRYETIMVEGGERAEKNGVRIGQRYKQHQSTVNFQAIGNPAVLGTAPNLLTLSRDPARLSQLQPVIMKIVVDQAHNHGPGRDESLVYKVRRCQGLILDLGDFDLPFARELRKRPDMVNVVTEAGSFATRFKTGDKEVVLARDTLIPLEGEHPFPGFHEKGEIAIGYSTDSPKFIVVWTTIFEIVD